VSDQQDAKGRFLPGNNFGSRATSKPKRKITNRILELLDEEVLAGTSRAKVIADKVVSMAEAGDMQAINFVADRTEGKVTQAMEISGPERSPIRTINANTTLQEAAKIYSEALADMGLVEDEVAEDNKRDL
jgi:hypothetical protein